MSDEQTVESGQASGVGAAAEGPVLLHIWEVDPSRAGVAQQRLDAMLGEASKEAGFVSARLLESPDRRSIAAVIEMRTVEDRRQLEQLPHVHDTLHHLDGALNIIVSLYHEVGRYDT
jgi:hypothetical protein